MAILALLWILPEECDQLGGEHLCDHKVVVATYSFLRSSLIEIFYVSAA
jgi:etoposide-induced 2.4 mRNA